MHKKFVLVFKKAEDRKKEVKKENICKAEKEEKIEEEKKVLPKEINEHEKIVLHTVETAKGSGSFERSAKIPVDDEETAPESDRGDDHGTATGRCGEISDVT